LQAWSSTQIPLLNATLNLSKLGPEKKLIYVLRPITASGEKMEAKETGRFTLSIKAKETHLIFRDVIEMSNAPNDTWKQDLEIELPKNHLLHPTRMTVDISIDQQKVRALELKHGQMKVYDWEGKRQEKPNLSDGILAFPVMLYLVPSLPRNIGDSFTFTWYMEPFGFLRKGKSKPGFVLTCLKEETIQLKKSPHHCVKFGLESIDNKIETYLWVDKINNVVIMYLEKTPDGSIEGTLED
jgi:hypothetical protein